LSIARFDELNIRIRNPKFTIPGIPGNPRDEAAIKNDQRVAIYRRGVVGNWAKLMSI